MDLEDLSLYFDVPDIPVKDSMSKLTLTGKVQSSENDLLLHWQSKARTFKRADSELQTVTFAYDEIESMEFDTAWFGNHTMIFKARDPRKLKEMPGSNVGRIVLSIPRKFKEQARKMVARFEYKLSELEADRSIQRLDELQAKFSQAKRPGGTQED